MDIRAFINEINIIYPDVDKNKVASDELIAKTELSIGYSLPESFKTFLKEFSNGIVLLDSEPIGGVGKNQDLPCGAIFLASTNINKDTVEITPTKETVSSDQLIVFSVYDTLDATNNCWAFICDKDCPNNEYRVGLISELTENIVVVLDSFEEWLTIFWNANKDTEDIISVFHCMYTTWEEREDLLRPDWRNRISENGDKFLYDNKYYDTIYGDAWERKYEIEIENIETKEITKTILPAINGGKLSRDEFEKNLLKEYRLIKFVEIINDKFNK